MKKKSTTLAEEARSILERMIIFNELDSGVMYSEKQLATMLDMGRTPVREALQRLCHDKMVEIHPRRGVCFPQITVENQLKLLEVRRGLEPLCIRYATMRGTVEQKRRMLRLADSMIAAANNEDHVALLEDIREAHDILAQATTNDYFSRVMSPLHGLSRRFWFLYIRRNGTIMDGAILHSDIMQAVARGDETLAVAASEALLDYLVEFSYNALKMDNVSEA
ncbi:MAG: GntR family transcriptional regulator [Proteobacteria bacterium]|nr:GntR family transcriptional regulator [Pseudomonadota bacterium]